MIRVSTIVTLLLCGAFLSCMPYRPFKKERLAPRVMRIEPTEYVVSPKSEFKLKFSKPISPDTLEATSIRLVEVSALEATVRTVSKKAQVACQVHLEEESTLMVIKPGYLKSSTQYALLINTHVRDIDGISLVNEAGLKADFRYDFLTEEAPPKLAFQDFSLQTQGPITADRRYFSLVFSKAMRGFGLHNVVLEPSDEQLEKPAYMLLYFPVEHRLQVVIDDNQHLIPGRVYQLRLKEGITSDSGLPLSPFDMAIQVGDQENAAQDVDVFIPDVEAYDHSARLTFHGQQAGTAKIWYAESLENLQCMAHQCPLTLTLGLHANHRFQSAPFVLLEGLEVDKTYVYRVEVEDSRGVWHHHQGELLTSVMPPIVINEVMANPDKQPESAGEYIEIWNQGSESVQLEGYALELEQSRGKSKLCLLPAGIKLEPHAYAVLVGQDFDLALYSTLKAEQVIKMPTKNVCGALSNSSRQKFMLRDGRQRIVSIFQAPFSAKEKGRSIERVSENYCYARQDVKATPGYENSVVTQGCEE